MEKIKKMHSYMEANKQQSYTSNKDKVPNLTFEGTRGRSLGASFPKVYHPGG